MSLKEEENKRFKDWDVQKVWLIEKSKNGLHCRRRGGINKWELGMDAWSTSSSSINDLDVTLGANRILWAVTIKFTMKYWDFVMLPREEKASCNARHLIFIKCLRCCHVSHEVHRLKLILDVITSQKNNKDHTVFRKVIHRLVRMHHIPATSAKVNSLSSVPIKSP